ncbi:MAG: methylenetetrahydrofolate--tRNA-(uracil(54)-C(5))-methyltransferase (FADH(2)-oxidizing) TrmFO [Acidobacteriota bacterium]
MKKVTIIGGGLAGIEAAWQVSKTGTNVDLYDLKPQKRTEGHESPYLGEMICSNSFGSSSLSTASGLLQEELKLLDSFYIRNSEKFRVPAGNSFSVDRIKLAEHLTNEIKKIPNVNIISNEVKNIPDTDGPVIIATGPLTSEEMAEDISAHTGRRNLFFYDSTSPIVNLDSLDTDKMFWASRYDKGDSDFLNIPLDKEQYYELVEDLNASEKVELKDFEDKKFFEACLPVEEIASRGKESLAFGPLKPVGLKSSGDSGDHYAVIQLRQDDVSKKMFQLVGFQTRLKWGEQKRIFRKLPGMENAEFERFGRMHRNSYINAPVIISGIYQSKKNPAIYFGGQISGVEGYLESISSGLLCGLSAGRMAGGTELSSPPADTASGSLLRYLKGAGWADFKPSKFTFGLLPEMKIKGKSKREKKEIRSNKALEKLSEWIKEEGIC